ncbi:MAG: cupin domain-containing protein [Spirochaetales bacterium]|nr:cupin domain-containing protein [Spirochaetales bacterium]
MEKLFFPEKDGNIDIIEAGSLSRMIKAYGEKTMMVEVYFETGARGTAHAHPHEQLSYCLEGEFDFFIEGESRSIKVGDTVLIPGGRHHGVFCRAKGRLLDVFSPPRKDFLGQNDDAL